MGISGVTSRPGRGHLGTGTLGGCPHRTASSQEGLKAWSSVAFPSGFQVTPLFLPAELCANIALTGGRGINKGFCLTSHPRGPSRGFSLPECHR